MRREDKQPVLAKDLFRKPIRVADALHAAADPVGQDYLGWFRLRTNGNYYISDKAVCHLEPVDAKPLPDWYSEQYEDIHALHFSEEAAREHKMAPGSLVLVSLALPRGYSYETDCGREYDVEIGVEVCYAVPHPAYEEAWRRLRERNAACTAAEEGAKHAELEKVWRQPWMMAVDIVYHDGTTFDGCGDGPPRTDERLRGYSARLCHSPELSNGYGRRGIVGAKHWLSYGQQRKTADEAVESLGEKLRAEGRKINLTKIRRVESRVW